MTFISFLFREEATTTLLPPCQTHLTGVKTIVKFHNNIKEVHIFIEVSLLIHMYTLAQIFKSNPHI